MWIICTVAVVYKRQNRTDIHTHTSNRDVMLRDAKYERVWQSSIYLYPSVAVVNTHRHITRSTPTACVYVCTRTNTQATAFTRVFVHIGAGLSVMCCPFVCECTCIGGQMIVGGAVYVHPIRILFYDRRVIMCAVMLNSTYLFLWNALSLLYIWIVNNFTMAFLSVVRQRRRWWQFYSSLVLVSFVPFRCVVFFSLLLLLGFSLGINLIYMHFGWCCLFARVIMIWDWKLFSCAKQWHSIRICISIKSKTR